MGSDGGIDYKAKKRGSKRKSLSQKSVLLLSGIQGEKGRKVETITDSNHRLGNFEQRRTRKKLGGVSELKKLGRTQGKKKTVPLIYW